MPRWRQAGNGGERHSTKGFNGGRRRKFAAMRVGHAEPGISLYTRQKAIVAIHEHPVVRASRSRGESASERGQSRFARGDRMVLVREGDPLELIVAESR